MRLGIASVVVASLVAVAGTSPARGDSPTWSTSAADKRGEVGRTFTYVCPPNGALSASVWGTDLYTTDSAICPAAVHAGKIGVEKGGSVIIQVRPGAPSYSGSVRRGVQSANWGAYESSFSFEVDQSLVPAQGERVAGWRTTAVAHKDAFGQTFTYVCPASGALGASVWGTDLYTTDSAICPAAVHAGKIDVEKGGRVTIAIRRGASRYRGSVRNGVQSSDWGAYASSFALR